MSTDIVKVSNKSYSVSQLPTDCARRRKYFNTFKEDTGSGNGELTSEESQILKDLGMDAKMINTLKMYLPIFFDNLQSCSSDSSLILNKKCNIPYYVLWSIMLANKEATDKRLRENKLNQSTHQLGVAMNSATIVGLRPKEITDEYDKLFQLLLTTSSVVPISQPNFGHLFKLPVDHEDINGGPVDAVAADDGVDDRDDDGVDADDDDNLKGVNQEYANDIHKLFKLILITSESTDQKSTTIEKLAALIIKLDRERKQPYYTFSQLGNTCATDSLFTTLLQSDAIKDLFIQNMLSLYTSENNKLIPVNNALHYALKRYINMLQLESSDSDSDNKSTRLDSVNLDRENPYGELMLKEISKDEACIGASRNDIIRYLEKLKLKLKSIPNMNLFNFFYGQTFRNNYTNKLTINNNLNSIKALYITHPTSSDSDERTGHAITILKIRNEWYISDNEIGLLHKINDNKFISVLFYKLYQANNNAKYEICQMWHTTEEQKSAQNLVYFFVFELAGKQYIYPSSNVPGTKDINTPVVTAERAIVFTYTEKTKDPILDEISKKFTQSEDEFRSFIITDDVDPSTVASSAAGAASAPAVAVKSGLFGENNDW